MSDSLFGELYLRSTRPFLSEAVTQAEVDFLKTQLPARGPLLDLGCGHGRHLRHFRTAIGVERDTTSLHEAQEVGQVVHADFRALPFTDNHFAGGWCWYNSLGTFEDDAVPQVLNELARCFQPEATFVVQGSHRPRIEKEPHSGFDGPLPDGSHLREVANYNRVRFRDEVWRELTLPDGRVMQASFFIRYFSLVEWQRLFADAGFEVYDAWGDVWGGPLRASSTDLIVGAKKRGVSR